MSRITRFAPSPTGELHLGHVYAAKVARDMAQRENGGQFLLRQEDIDSSRVRPEYYQKIEADLLWLGLDWDGEILLQSQRSTAYEAALETLRKLGLVYPCFCTRREIQEELTRIHGAPHSGENTPYPGICRHLDPQQTAELIANGSPHCWRLDSAAAREIHGELHFHDLRFGQIKVDPSLNGDVVLARKDIGIAYHLAVVVDDEFQAITHVTRGEDLLSATHVHRQLQAILGYREPEYFHHRLVLDENGKRLAKRDAARSIRSLRESGMSAREVIGLLGI
ncbi:tRNA glutamyl-Q(34) synthetase GluQRS [Luteolibacter algae]|uniref:tRNA glutamyl-Q(34) synthetase GluQRS n=2 Tax=Luteolibacter algae TaxID=454151 RepID=A0ABW5D9F3_9BACT